MKVQPLLLLLTLVCASPALARDGDEVVRLVTKVNSVLTKTEKMLVKEEQMLEKLYNKIAPKQHMEALKDKSTAQIKEFLQTFDERPALVTRGEQLDRNRGREM